jgi:hypothetical protein
MLIYHIEFNKDYIKEGIEIAFKYIESLDDIVGTIYGQPDLIKKVVLLFNNEIKFDFVYQGIGIFRTAYLKYIPTTKDNELIFLNKNETYKLKLIFI